MIDSTELILMLSIGSLANTRSISRPSFCRLGMFRSKNFKFEATAFFTRGESLLDIAVSTPNMSLIFVELMSVVSLTYICLVGR